MKMTHIVTGRHDMFEHHIKYLSTDNPYTSVFLAGRRKSSLCRRKPRHGDTER
jgi:hypothetical protein